MRRQGLETLDQLGGSRARQLNHIVKWRDEPATFAVVSWSESCASHVTRENPASTRNPTLIRLVTQQSLRFGAEQRDGDQKVFVRIVGNQHEVPYRQKT